MSPSTLCFIMLLVMHSMMMCCSGNEGNTTFRGCITREKNALLKFKVSFSDPSNRLSSWNTNTDCCEWQGVECDKLTGHVIALDLHNEEDHDDYDYSSFYDNMLSSEMIDSSILELKHLRYIDLSGNDFQESPIPPFLELLNELHYLNLSQANLTGVVPHHLGNLSQLNVFDLSNNGYYSQLVVDDFMWASRLSLLRYLDMSGVNLNQTNDLLQVLNMLPSIKVLRLSQSNLENRNLGHAFVNASLSNIQQLHLSGNLLDGELPFFLSNLTSLRDLDLSINNYNSCNQLHLNRLTNLVRLDLSDNSLDCNVESISRVLPNNCHMESLNLYSNSFSGDISNLFLLNLSRCLDNKLATLNLGNNQLYGQLPEQIDSFTMLKLLDLSHNNISGPIPTSIGNLSALTTLDISDNIFNGSIPSSIGNLSALTNLYLHYNQLNGDIPHSLGKLSNLVYLDISHNNLNSTISEIHFSILSELRILWLGDNNLIKFVVGSDWVPPFQLTRLYMRSCQIVGGEFPQWLQTQKELEFLDMSNCSISGTFPNWFRHMNLYLLDLSSNGLSGYLPDSWENLTSLAVLILSSNQLSGFIPDSIGGAYALEWLQLSNNNFTGEIPFSMRNCTALRVLDIGENSISGQLPQWIGNDLLNLKVLRLRSNELYGTIPRELCQLSQLQILDLANNKLVGNIPRCFGNFSGMVIYNPTQALGTWGSLVEVIKGVAQEYFQTLRYVVNMDLSDNNLIGEIPLELTRLIALHFLNLSRNHLQGKIPGRIGDMRSLESLDLSKNNLSGNITMSLSDLTSLSHLNLSHNNLTGEIPTGRQLQTLEDPTIYAGNSGLCGPPLVKKCHDDRALDAPTAETHVADSDEDKVEKIWLYGIIASGFTTGFWGVIGVLVLKQSWRDVYFRFTDGVIVRISGRWINMH